jgi:hypothetical protein
MGHSRNSTKSHVASQRTIALAKPLEGPVVGPARARAHQIFALHRARAGDGLALWRQS